ncbi:major facilitator superfamily domain-containing protein [Lentinula lateritia]|uniref:Major facilitator superfamily domain-containing protein n=1 Tax=Lentinula aff. lateritia TaxID=2804960 RepID=A0ACC1TVQ5_9AGAR|nr:major facilitator superfamily domain-containing protein [Lentinula aff. lateritia]KAJ3851334.1 major facilitator superfamily domain-containing protein [Lentinula lateritia]
MSDSTSYYSNEKKGRALKVVSESDVDIAAQVVSKGDGGELDPQVAKKLLRKIDLHIMPLMCLLFLFQRMTFADKTTLGQSAVLGIEATAHINQNQFNWLSSVFYLAYLAFEYPQNFALQRFPVGKWMSVNIFVWAVVLLSHAACHSFGGLFAVRFILGICEGAITPGFMIVTSMFYTRQEQNKRVGYWFLMNGFAVIFLGFVSFGLLHTKTHHFAPWQWLMIITGLITLVTSVCFWFWFPDSPTTAWFLTVEERALAVRRIRVNQTGVENKHWKREQFIETLRDPKIWVMVLFAAIANIPNSLTNQRQLIIAQFGFTPIETTLLGCVDGVMEILSIWLGISLAGMKNIGRAYAGVIIYIPGLLGALLVNLLPSHLKVGLLFGYWLSIFSIAPFAIFLGWVSGLVAGHTKRTTTNALVLIGYAIGNFASPFIWKSEYQPRNHVPWDFLVTSMGASILILLTLRTMLARENAHRDRETCQDDYDNVYLPSKESELGAAQSKRKIDKVFLDLTDLQNRDFRYTL